MRLARRLILAIVLAIVSVLAVHGYYRVRREAALLDREGRRDHLLLGRALGVGMAEAWRRAGPSAALALVDEMNQREPEIEIRWIGAEGDAMSSPEALAAARAGREVAWIERRPDGAELLFTLVPVRLADGRVGAVELSESRAADQRFVHTSVQNTVLATLAAALVSALLTAALGVLFVGRPVRQLVAQARRVGAGEFDTRLRLRARDELGELSEEMNAMCDQLAAAHDRLLAETAARLAAQQRLEHADRLTTVGKLAAGIAHELGTPLHVIAQRARMVVEREVEGDAARDKARIILEQTDRMTVIIRQLLDFARRRGPQSAVRDVCALAGNVVSLLAPLAQKRGVEVTLTRPEGAVDAMIDDGQIQQVLTNLVVNGIDAMPRGGRLTVTVARAHLAPPEEQGAAPAACASVEVRDEGEGIAEDVLPHIFEPFFTTKDVGEGTGLGLSVAYGLVREHGGWIAVDSRAGQGTRFTVYLPVGAPS
ncbi:MAG: ATP-binding protein [Polyangiales bacterium]